MGMNPRLLRPKASGFTPRNISGLALWLDASDSSTLFQNSDGTTPATATSDPVGYWGNKVGAGAFTQSTAFRRPVRNLSFQNNKPAVVGDGVDDWLSAAASSIGLSSVTAATGFFVYRSTGGGVAWDFGTASSGNTAVAGLVYDDFFRNFRTPGSFTAPSIGVTAVTSPASGGRSYRINGAAMPLTDSGLFATPTTAYVGGGPTFPSGFISFGGGVCEALVYGTVLSAPDIGRIERYLAAKWGITLAPQVSNADAQDWVNRVYANGGTVSSATANAVNTFCNDIDSAGIRDRFFRLNLFCGTGLAACLVPLYRGTSLAGTQYGNATDTNQNFVSGDYSESGGLASSAASTKALSTGVMPMESGSPLFNYGHYFAHVIALPTARSSVMGVRKDPAPSNRHAFQLDSTGQFWGDWCHVNRFNGSASGVSAGKTIIMQAAQVANATQVYASGLLTLTGAIGTFTGTASQGAAIFAARGDFGSGFITSDFSTMSMGAYSIGLDFTAAQALAYHTAYAALATALGRTIA
jgi:hypothetical protein